MCSLGVLSVKEICPLLTTWQTTVEESKYPSRLRLLSGPAQAETTSWKRFTLTTIPTGLTSASHSCISELSWFLLFLSLLSQVFLQFCRVLCVLPRQNKNILIELAKLVFLSLNWKKKSMTASKEASPYLCVLGIPPPSDHPRLLYHLGAQCKMKSWDFLYRTGENVTEDTNIQNFSFIMWSVSWFIMEFFFFYLMWFQVKKLKFDIMMMNFTIYSDIGQCLF